MLLIGETLNATIPRVGAAIRARDAAFLQDLARRQAAAGARMLDVNAATGLGDEAEDLAWLVRCVQAAVDLPLLLDSGNAAALRAGIRAHRGKPIVNSVDARREKLEALLPALAGTGCGVVGLCLGEELPRGVEERLRLARVLVKELNGAGIAPQDVYLDPLVMSAGADHAAGRLALDALSGLKEELPGVRTIVGLSNVSHGLPWRKPLNRVFLALLVEKGLDACIADVLDAEMEPTWRAAMLLTGQDPHCRGFTGAFRARKRMERPE